MALQCCGFPSLPSGAWKPALGGVLSIGDVKGFFSCGFGQINPTWLSGNLGIKAVITSYTHLLSFTLHIGNFFQSNVLISYVSEQLYGTSLWVSDIRAPELLHCKGQYA